MTTVYYFNGRGRAECIRVMLTYFGVKFTDTRYEMGKFTEEDKSRTTFGQLPHFEDADVKVSQTMAIELYLATKHHIVGKNPVETAQIHSIVLSTNDVFQAYFTSRATEESKLKFRTEMAPRYIKVWEKLLKENGGKHLWGNTLTWADFAIFNAIDYVFYLKEGSIMDNFPACVAFHKEFLQLPQLTAYFAARSTTTPF
ncbi:hypothetical protein SAMD00019534_111180 [Acytostelium subglobosum LB1]|uniref:hypothetical protein n=1 Tax=Acytostelium subglobosum LB1 TaxID=1410327 RepID=UPI000644D4A2|nr:hypothetical protein SAMD00019534_111180 [Acytostelium subglobosum LB1]GAM27942.1 hypothetical protein SAMD00019534_111180 [Acytostelium subglobosum LB1]|eukprot:XP_012749225.1 hypothetical protein SAMD00019534_111180 [Acytostelium subglobosum LB1]